MTTAPMRALAAACLFACAGVPAYAQSTPAGLWKTVDDATRKEKSLVRIVETNGVYTGKVEKITDPDAPKDATCKDCSDDRKDKPVVGMTIIRNVKANGEDKAVFDGGDILDPNNGKVYRVRLRPFDEGRKLEVRGYLGPFYRNQTWQRVE
jgi:uncharacterized protein (DUF2147 family)